MTRYTAGKTLAILLLSAALASCASPTHRVGDGRKATRAEIDRPAGLAVVGGALYVAEMDGGAIRRIDLSTGIITTVVPKRDARSWFHCLAPDSRGGLLACEGFKVVRVDLRDRSIHDVGEWIHLNRCTADSAGNVFVGQGRHVTRIDASTGRVSDIAGTGVVMMNYRGDGGPAISADLQHANGVVVDSDGNVYLAQVGDEDEGNRILRIDARTGIVTTIVGPETVIETGAPQPEKGLNFGPRDLALDGHSGLLFLDEVKGRVLRVDLATGRVIVLAGGAEEDGHGNVGTSVHLANPSAVTIDAEGNIYVAEFVGNRVRRIDARTGVVTTIGGNGKPKRAIILL